MWKNLLTPDQTFTPVVLQGLGVGLILITVAVWLFGGELNPTLLGTGGSLLGIGEYAAAANQMKTLQQHFDRFAAEHPVPSPPPSSEKRTEEKA